MDPVIILLRIMHIFGGVLWVGGAIFFFFFVEPSVKATAPSSQSFMQYLMVRKHFSLFMTIVSLATIGAGAAMYWRDSAGLQPVWIMTHTGFGFTLGAAVGIATALMGLFFIKPHVDKLDEIGEQIQTSGGTPTPKQLNEMAWHDRALNRLGRLDFVMLTIALLAMATARYW